MRYSNCSPIIFVLAVAVFSCVSTSNAAPDFYFTTHADGTGGGDLLLGTSYGSSGTLYLAVDSDIHLAEISLDVLSSNPDFFKFTGANVINNGRYFALDNPLIVATDGSSITTIGGGAVPGLSGTGVGPGSGVPNPTAIASLTYAIGNSGSSSNLSLRIGQNGVAGWDGTFTTVRFGSSLANVFGGATGTTGKAGIAFFAPNQRQQYCLLSGCCHLSPIAADRPHIIASNECRHCCSILWPSAATMRVWPNYIALFRDLLVFGSDNY